MNESKVEVILGHDCNVSTAYTTHADYRVLDDKYQNCQKDYAACSSEMIALEREVARLQEELASIKARVADYERAVTEQAMLTECVSVTGRDPSDVIRDVVQWHVSNAAQPVEAVDVRTAFEVWAGAKGYALHIRDMKGSTRLGEYGYADTQRLWETWQAALAHPRPVGVPDGWTVERGPDVLGRLYGIFAAERLARDFLMAAFPVAAAPDGEVG